MRCLMASIRVQPRQTPEERAGTAVEVSVDAGLADRLAALEDWIEPRSSWTLTVREGHDFGRANNVEVLVVFASGEQTCSLSFRLDQLDGIEEAGYELLLRFEETDGIARIARLTPTGLDVELFHILTFT
jgi:hypothetical protein